MSGDGYGYDYMYSGRSWFNGGVTAEARDAALAAGIDTINGITITHDYWRVGDQDLTTWYANNVAAGDNAFVIEASSFSDFGDALTTKLTAEIEGGYVPEGATEATPISTAPGPTMGGAMSFLIAGLFMVRRRKKSEPAAV